MVLSAQSLNQELRLIEDIVYIGSHNSYQQDLAKNFTKIVEQIVCERSIEDFSGRDIKKLEKIVENPFFFDYEFEKLDLDVPSFIVDDRFILEPVKGKYTTVHSNKTLETYSKLNKNHDITEFLPMVPIPGVKHLKMRGDREKNNTNQSLHYHLYRRGRGDDKLYNIILTFDPTFNINFSDNHFPPLYYVKHSNGGYKIKFHFDKFGKKTKEKIYDFALKPIINKKVKLEDFREPSKKKSILFYEP